MKSTCAFLISISIFAITVQSLSLLQQPILKPEEPSQLGQEADLDRIIASSPLLSFHRDIVQISSISDNEKNVGDFILNFLAKHNFTTEKQIVTPKTESQEERFNIYAYTGETRHAGILLTSHIDTVPPYIPYSLHAPDTDTTTNKALNRSSIKISGRGTVDAKASIASIIYATLETLSENPTASIALLFDVGEENSGAGMKHFSSSDLNPSPSSFRSVIFGEPTDLALVAGHKGTFGFKILAKGSPAHSGYPWLGASAISAILPVLQSLDELDDISPEEGGLPVSELLGRSTLNIGVLNGGVAGNVVPGFAEAGVKVRVAGGELEDIERIIERAVEKATRSSKSKTDVAGNGNSADISIQFESGSLPEFFDTDVTGFEVISVNYGTDAFSLHVADRENGEKVKRYLYGPGSIYVAHGDDEGLTVGELEEAVRGYKRLIEASL